MNFMRVSLLRIFLRVATGYSTTIDNKVTKSFLKENKCM